MQRHFIAYSSVAQIVHLNLKLFASQVDGTVGAYDAWDDTDGGPPDNEVCKLASLSLYTTLQFPRRNF